MRYGHYIFVTKHELNTADRFFARWGSLAVLIARLLPVIRTFIAFPAGVARMNRTKFHVYTFVGSFPWCLGLGWVGQKLGSELMKETSPLKHAMHKLDAVIAVVVIVAGVWFVRSRLKVLKANREEDRREAMDKTRLTKRTFNKNDDDDAAAE